MKLWYLGTGSSDAIPNPFCECPTCEEARKKKGRNIRTRFQVMIDERLLIDWNADSFMRFQNANVCLARGPHSILFTHSHDDHLYEREFENIIEGYCETKPEDRKPYEIYVGESGYRMFDSWMTSLGKAAEGKYQLHLVHPYDNFEVEGYRITAFPADHDPLSSPFNYLIEDGKTSLLLLHDTGYPKEEVWEKWSKRKTPFGCVSLDCNFEWMKGKRNGHMCLEVDEEVVKRMRSLGLVDDKTTLVLSHFGHCAMSKEAFSYEGMVKRAEPLGFITSFDGMKIEF